MFLFLICGAVIDNQVAEQGSTKLIIAELEVIEPAAILTGAEQLLVAADLLA
ncbi:MAG: hypothetical protein R2794_07960 [Chitinophagales bacterium]